MELRLRHTISGFPFSISEPTMSALAGAGAATATFSCFGLWSTADACPVTSARASTAAEFSGVPPGKKTTMFVQSSSRSR
uniref:Uncharacterized protein n=1 Tax=Zea mays TaxID=4577 RepID=C4J4E0_MAIZE|nr:unknown [Zea mays]